MMMIDTDFENNLRRKNSVNIELKTWGTFSVLS